MLESQNLQLNEGICDKDEKINNLNKKWIDHE